MDRLFQSDDVQAGERQPPPWLKPAITWLLQQILRPFSVADVTASVKDDGLWIMTWMRVGDFRLAPITVAWKRVDNPDAARAFVKELNKRKVSTAHPGRFPGPLDYWVSWVLVVFLLVVLPLRWFRGGE